MANPHGFNLHGGMDFSPPQKLRRRTYSDRALPSIAALRQELNIVDRGHNPPGKGGYEYMQQQPPGAAPAAPLAPMPVLKTSVSLPAMPPLRMWPAAPWSGGEGVVEIGAPAGEQLREVQTRRVSTRERGWLDRLAAADEGRGPDPITMHILTKHGKRFKPGGLASRSQILQNAPADGSGFSQMAIARVRMCSMRSGYCNIRDDRAV